jgi:hypothetical protein
MRPAADAAVDAAAPIDAAIGLSQPQNKTSIPPQLAAAPAWIMRRLDGGAITYPQVLETFTLRRDGASAALTMEVQHAATKRGFMEVGEWKPVSTKHYLGTAAEAGGKTTIDIALGAESLHFTCKRTQQSVAAATAVRRRHAYEVYRECGDPGRWEPAATTRVDVLRCELPEGFQEAHGWFVPYLAFTPAPGIEWLHVNDDCSMQGGGWRRIASDGSIAAFRSPRDVR